ncbi:nucleoside-diphosphate kinase [candidate division KSB1 bacterium]|nr:nucleoside-diphosphate kinase [candidate division KSB1 bacterium]
MERTCVIFKPDCLLRNLFGKVITIIEENGFAIIGLKMIRMTLPLAEGFYKMHKGKDFYEPLLKFMGEAPCVVAVLEKENAVQDWRQLMGSTDPAEAAEGTIRYLYAVNVRRNVVHGSDSVKSAQQEIGYFFSESEIIHNIQH